VYAFDMGVFAGPLDLDVLNTDPYESLEMGGMVVYTMSSCCTFLTFQWLADFLLRFLKFLHDFVVFDWGLAIILLVIVVRTLLHPLTKKSQINMQRFGKQMSSMKPEIDKIQKKYAGDAQKLRVEQARLMREHGVNPLQMLGCLPMFLQMPIWIALWAMLYLAFDIRQQPAFYGVFQIINNWQFLADLSSPDNFWILPGGGFTIPLLGWKVTSLNLLPLLMGLVFYFQQKYMSPPPTPNMTPEQLQQQKIMKVMMVVLFPLMLYKAPSGLTLYIFTSSCIGILESRYIRQHITEMELNPPKPREPGDKKPKDRLARMWADKLEAARAKRAQQQQGQRSFKKRK
jgi:YidC/Oxa1 family membrane protein insertase